MNHWISWALRGSMALAALIGGLGAGGRAHAQPLVDPVEVFQAAPGELAQLQAAPALRDSPGLLGPTGGCFRHSGCGAFTAGLLPLAALRLNDAAPGFGAVEALCAAGPRPGPGWLLTWARAISLQSLCAGLRQDSSALSVQAPTARHAP